MGVRLHIILLRDGNNPEHIAKVNAKRALNAANIALPKELEDYFCGGEDEDGPLEIPYEAKEWNDDNYSGYEINLSELPKGVVRIRVVLG